MWAGDFNQSTLFDSPSDPLHFSRWLSKAKTFGFDSLYHRHARCEHGAERDKTFFLHHNAEKPHHIDYIFAKPALYTRGFEFAVGRHREWAKLSDHMPLTFTMA
jgi:endonuclease/exonuclease/phosphatase family metal-dependent hydrolase